MAETTEEPQALPGDGLREGIVDELRRRIGDALVDVELRPNDDLWVRVATDAWAATGEALRGMGFSYFCFLSGIDWLPSPYGRSEDNPDEPPPVRSTEVVQGVTGGATRFQVFARVVDPLRHVGITLKADVADDAMAIGSWHAIYAGANWHERETHEMFGIDFAGHPDLRNMYLPTEFEGYPLRKDFPLLSRMIKPWPGIVDVEPMPAEDEDGDGDGVADEPPATADGEAPDKAATTDDASSAEDAAAEPPAETPNDEATPAADQTVTHEATPDQVDTGDASAAEEVVEPATNAPDEESAPADHTSDQATTDDGVTDDQATGEDAAPGAASSGEVTPPVGAADAEDADAEDAADGGGDDGPVAQTSTQDAQTRDQSASAPEEAAAPAAAAGAEGTEAAADDVAAEDGPTDGAATDDDTATDDTTTDSGEDDGDGGDADAGEDAEQGVDAPSVAVAESPDGGWSPDIPVADVEGPFGVGSKAARADGSQPVDHPIKALTSSQLFFIPGSEDYDVTEPDVWFDSQTTARQAGFRSPYDDNHDDLDDLGVNPLEDESNRAQIAEREESRPDRGDDHGGGA